MFKSTSTQLIVLGVLAEIVLGFGSGETAGTRTMFILGGLCLSGSVSCCSPAPASVR